MPIDVANEPVVVTFTRNAAAKMAGQTRIPRTRSATRAIPVGGQTAVALGLTSASFKPSLPATKYRSAALTTTAGRGERSGFMSDALGGEVPGSVPRRLFGEWA